jgi:hypothetical protein
MCVLVPDRWTDDGIEPNGEVTMNHLLRCSSLAAEAAQRRWRTVLGIAATTLALAGVTDASAEPKAGPRDAKAHHEPGKAPPSDKAGPRDEHGRGKADGKADFLHGMRDHERGVAGGPGFDRHHHGETPEAVKKRIEELKQKEAQGTISAEEKQELARIQQHMGPRQTGEQRKARLADLKQKEAAGTLTAEEKAELDKVQQIQARHDTMEKAAAEKAQNRKDRSREAKRQALKEYPKLGQDPTGTAEYQKHADRLAKLERAKDLAAADQRTDTVQKIDALITQENQRHQTWLAKHQSAAPGTSQGVAQ